MTFPVKSLLQAANPHRDRVILTKLTTVPGHIYTYSQLLKNSFNLAIDAVPKGIEPVLVRTYLAERYCTSPG